MIARQQATPGAVVRVIDPGHPDHGRTGPVAYEPTPDNDDAVDGRGPRARRGLPLWLVWAATGSDRHGLRRRAFWPEQLEAVDSRKT